MITRSRADRRGGRLALALTLALVAGVLVGCDGLLDVELPDQIPEESLQDPEQAELLVNSAIGRFECTWSEFVASNAAGNEDVYMRITGWWASFAEYQAAANEAACNTDDFFYGWWSSLHAGRGLAETIYGNLEGWTDEEVLGDRQQLMATAALYTGLNYQLLGEHFCEIAVDGGELMTPEETLMIADQWVTTALDHIEQAGGDFELPGAITDPEDDGLGIQQMAYIVRARIRFALGETAEAAADAGQVEQGFVAVATREQSSQRSRANRVFTAHTEDHWGTVQGPIGGEEWLSLGVAAGWEEQQPFTGYQNLGILPDGRAVTAEGFPITTTEFPTAEEDPRVPVEAVGEFNEWDPVYQQNKYTSPSDDIPIANWEEAWLILAEIEGEGDPGAAVARVNDIRTANGIPTVTYGPSTPDEVERMIIEERRRSLFLEGRFWSTKIRKDLWFPEGVGTTPYNLPYGQAVRMLMPPDEYVLNENFDQTDQGTLCGDEAPEV